MSKTHFQEDSRVLAQDMQRLCLSRDVKNETLATLTTPTTPTTNSSPRFYRLDMSHFAYNFVSVWRVCFYKPLPPDAAPGTERCRLQSKWRQRQLMPLIFDALGIEPDCHWTNGCDRIFSTPGSFLDKLDAASDHRAEFEINAPRGAGGRFGVVVELVEQAMTVPRALSVGSSATSLTIDQFRLLESAVQAFARAQVWKAKRDRVECWSLVGKNQYFDATPEHVLSYRSFQARRGVAVSLMRDGYLLKLTPLSRTFLVEGSFSKFVASLLPSGDMETIPNDVLEYLKKFCSHIKVRYNYLGTSQSKDTGGSSQAKRLDEFEIHIEGRLRRICALGNNAEKTKFLYASKTSGSCSKLLSVKEHFENHVFPGTKLRYPRWPVANTGTTENPTWIPLELLWIEADQPIENLPQQFPIAVSSLFSEKHSENVERFDKTFFGSLLKLDQDRLGIKLEEIRREKAAVPDPPKTIPNRVQEPCASRELLFLHFEGISSEGEWNWDCGATFGKLLVALQKYGGVKSESDELPSCSHIKASRLGPRELFQLLESSKNPPNNKLLLIACLTGEKQERDQAYRQIKKWGHDQNVSTLVVQGQKFRNNLNVWSKNLSGSSDKKERAAIGYVKSLSRKVLARYNGITMVPPKKSRKSVDCGDRCNGKLEGVDKDADVPDLKLL